MLLSSSVLCLLVYLSCAFALPKTTSSFVLHEKRESFSQTWTKVSRAHPSELLELKIGLTQSNHDRAEEYLLDVSHPQSANFGNSLNSKAVLAWKIDTDLETIGKHWTAEKVANTFAPSKESVDSVTNWLVESGIDAKRYTFSTGAFNDYQKDFKYSFP